MEKGTCDIETRLCFSASLGAHRCLPEELESLSQTDSV